MKSKARMLSAALGAMIWFCGCAHSGMGSAPGSQSGEQQGDSFRTETLTPGVGSALFPEPGGR